MSGIYSRLRCKHNHSEFKPLKHQKDVTDYFIQSPYKGLLLYHELGSGKTCTSITIADEMLRRNIVKYVYVFTAGSLRQNWFSEYCNLCGDASLLPEKYVFVTYNYKTTNIPNLDDSLIIIDEVHNFINSVKNKSKYVFEMYKILSQSKCKLLALSGTPIYNYFYEFAILGHLLKPGIEFPYPFDSTGELNIVEFKNLFNINAEGSLSPKNEHNFLERIKGIISYFPGAGDEFVPEIREQEPIKIKMLPEQNKLYFREAYVEKLLKFAEPNEAVIEKLDEAKIDEAKVDIENKKVDMRIVAHRRILTRRVSNIYYPIDLKKIPDVVKPAGWIDNESFKNGELYKLYSPKMTAILLNVSLNSRDKHVIFTFFKTKSGAYMLKTMFDLAGISCEIYSGDLTDYQKRRLIERYNDENNKYGEHLRIVIITEAGVEGISFKDCRHFHIVESNSIINKTIQAIGRVARYKSHIRLPENERNIYIWKYWSMLASNEEEIEFKKGDTVRKVKFKLDKAVDEILYIKGSKVLHQNKDFLDLLKKVSVTTY